MGDKPCKAVHSRKSGLNRNTTTRQHTKEFISKAPSPLPSPSRGEGCNTSPPLRGGDEGEGDVCGFTNDRISKYCLCINDGIMLKCHGELVETMT